MNETNTLLNSIVLAGGLAGSIYLFATGLTCVNMYLNNQKSKFSIYLNLGVMGFAGLELVTMCYKKFQRGYIILKII